MATWRHLGGTLLGVLVAAFVLLACTSEPSDVVIEQQGDDLVAPEVSEPLTPFGERLYGSAWSVVQGQLEGEAVVANGGFPQRQLGGFSFFGTRTELSISVNHECGSETSPVEITDDRIIPADFTMPPSCQHLTVFNLFAQPEIEAAFNSGRLELTGAGASLVAKHFVSVSDNGAAPLYVTGDIVVRYEGWSFANPSDVDDPTADQFEVTIGSGRCGGPRGAALTPEITYLEDRIEIAIGVYALPIDYAEGRTLDCRSPARFMIVLDEAREGRPIESVLLPTRALRPEER